MTYSLTCNATSGFVPLFIRLTKLAIWLNTDFTRFISITTNNNNNNYGLTTTSVGVGGWVWLSSVLDGWEYQTNILHVYHFNDSPKLLNIHLESNTASLTLGVHVCQFHKRLNSTDKETHGLTTFSGLTSDYLDVA